nr:uncharacterized protein LOC128687883 isoform X2 [Cherax quadricarinatus]
MYRLITRLITVLWVVAAADVEVSTVSQDELRSAVIVNQLLLSQQTDILKELLNNTQHNQGNTLVYVGATGFVGGRNAKENRPFKWLDGRHIATSDWASTEPNNHDGSEYCVALNHQLHPPLLDLPCSSFSRSVLPAPLHTGPGRVLLPEYSQTHLGEGTPTLPGNVGRLSFTQTPLCSQVFHYKLNRNWR